MAGIFYCLNKNFFNNLGLWYNFISNRKGVFMTKAEVKKMGKGFAIASMVCGIVGLVFCWSFILSFILAIIALVFGIISLAKKGDGKGMAIAGVATGGLAFVCSIIVGFVVFTGIGILAGLFESLLPTTDCMSQINKIDTDDWTNNDWDKYYECLDADFDTDFDFDLN